MGGSGTGTGAGGGATGGGGGGTGGMTVTGANCDPPEGQEGTVVLTDYLTGLNLPMMVTYAPGDDESMYIVERAGRVLLSKNGAAPTLFLDITSMVVTGGERGLLGLALHPDFVNNGRFWVHYSRATTAQTCQNGACDNQGVIQEFRRDPNDPNVADPNPVHPPVFTVDEPFSNHNGGHIEFSPVDGFLYIGFGDGGDGGDPYGNGPNKDTHLATLLRLDVSPDDGTYDIPDGNITDGAPEIFDWGLRNPYRWSFDICTGDRYIADVGQNAWEEVDIAPASQGNTNWGWDCREGMHDYGGATAGCPFGGETDPVWEYSHNGGNRSITGGYVYRGSEIPWLRGAYFFGDYSTGQVWYFRYDGGTVAAQDVIEVNSIDGPIGGPVGFGQDNLGEVYMVDINQNKIQKVIAQ